MAFAAREQQEWGSPQKQKHDAAAKRGNYRHAELSQSMQMLFRDATWDKLNDKVLTEVAHKFASKFSVSITKKKFGQFVPVAGIAFGAVSNFAGLRPPQTMLTRNSHWSSSQTPSCPTSTAFSSTK